MNGFARAVLAVATAAVAGCAQQLDDCGRACLLIAGCQTSDVAGDAAGTYIEMAECGNVECDAATQACVLDAAGCAEILACRWPGGVDNDAVETDGPDEDGG
jgi:hypothetical protein